MSDIPEGMYGVSYVTIAQIFASLSGAAFWIIFAIIVHPLAYGHLSWLVSVAMLISTFCVFGMGKVIVSYYPRERNEGLLSEAVLLVFVSSLFFGGLVSLFVDIWTGLLVIGFSLFSIGFHMKLAKRDYEGYMWVWVGARSLAFLLPLLVYELLGLISGVVVALAVSYFVFGLWILRYITKPNFGNLKPKTKFAMGAWLADLSAVSMNFLDKIIIGLLFGMMMLGFYQFAIRIFLLFAVFPQIMFFYLLPEKSAGRRTKRIEVNATIFSIGLMGIMLVFASIVIPRYFPSFSDGVEATQIMGFALVPATIAQMKISDLYARGKSSVVLASYVSALTVGLTGVVSLGKHFGLIGLASSVFLTQLALALSVFLFPRLTDEDKKLAGGTLGAIVLTALVISTMSVQPLTIEIVGTEVKGTGLAMDTTVSIIVIDENVEKAKAAIKAAYDEIKRIETLMSAEDEASEIYLLNHNGTAWTQLSCESIYILKKAIEYSELSDGYFDPTVKPLVDLWMKKTKKTGRIPRPEELTEAMELVGWKNLAIDENRKMARFLQEGMQVTLGAIAKGYAVDRGYEILKDFGVESGLVNIGGDLRGFGSRTWRIGIQDPRGEGILEVLELENFSIATSGDYMRMFFIGKRRIHHLINPKTGEPATECMSVTVITENCVDADALSTAVFVMGPTRGIELLDNLSDRGMLSKGMIIASGGEVLISRSWNSLPHVVN